MASQYVIGFDCGGSRTGAAAVDAKGHILCRAQGAGGNHLSLGLAHTVGVMRELYRSIDAKLDGACLALSIGSSALDERAGANDPALFALLNAIQQDPVLGSVGRCFIRSDAFMALYALSGKAPGALLIAGTGMMGLARRADGTLKTVGGWGDKLDDAGSGFWIAKEGVKAALDYADTLDEDAKAIHQSFLAFFELSDATDFTDLLYSPDFTKDRLSAFSKRLSLLAKTDPAAKKILLRAAAELTRYALALCRFVDDMRAPFGIYGSVLVNDRVVRGEFERLMRARFPELQILVPTTDSETAAALYAWRKLL